MILTATFVAVETWAEIHDDETPDPMRGLISLIMLFGFAWFDLRMAEIVAGGGA